MRSLKAIVWNLEEVLSPLLRAGLATSSMGDWVFPIEPRVAELALAKDASSCNQPEPTVSCLRGNKSWRLWQRVRSLALKQELISPHRVPYCGITKQGTSLS